ncbi:class I SAM-dependent methyltransferase [Thermodesulfobacteriota bacterium]
MAEHVCPVWVGHLLESPLRKLFDNPQTILGLHVTDGMTALDIGCAMGFFSLPLAEMVGVHGKVICIDLQKRMIEVLEKRARKAGLSERIESRLCGRDSLGLEKFSGTIDFALASAVVHEVPDAGSFFSEVHEVVKPDGKFLVVEPKGHVSESDFNATVSLAEQKGFHIINRSRTFSGRAALFQK